MNDGEYRYNWSVSLYSHLILVADIEEKVIMVMSLRSSCDFKLNLKQGRLKADNVEVITSLLISLEDFAGNFI